MSQICRLAAAALLIGTPTLALASEEGAELWYNPGVTFGLDDNTAIEIETAQRIRSASKGADTYYARLWVVQDVTDRLSISGGFERRVNNGAANETRLLQQLSGKAGIVRGRLRLEQRFVDGAEQTAWRLRSRVGVNVPLDTDKKWRAIADTEGFFTLRATRAGGQTGLTGLRSQAGFAHEVSDRIGISLTYVRNQEIIDGRPDRVGHAPLFGIEFSF
jgi:hypothetical protein